MERKERFARAELGDGVAVLTEEMPGVRSVAVGVWVRHGSAHEPVGLMGVSHMLEHMVFKGTGRRTARDLALEVERLGGSLDAYTTREHTGYHARVLDAHLDVGLDVLTDLVLDPALRSEDLDLEREVVLEEISTVEDTPDDLVFEIHSEALWGGHPYGYRILGTPETVSGLRRDDLVGVHRDAYRGRNLVVAAAGNIAHDDLVARVEALLGDRIEGGVATEPPSEPPPLEPRELRVARATAQTHLVFGTRSIPHGDPRRFALVLLSNAFGGGMSSRLFQRVREELGLAYTVYSFHSFYHDAGVCGIYVGTRPDSADRAADVVREELRRLARDGLTAQELEDAKSQVKGQLMLALESSGARLNRLAGLALYDEPFRTLDETIARIEAVTREDVAAVAADHFDPERQVTVRLGPET